MTPSERESILQVISDASKDAYGFRVRLDYAAMSDEELQKTYDGYCKTIEEVIVREAQEEDSAWFRFLARIEKMVSDFEITRATAIRWDMEAEDVNDDVGFYAYKNGLNTIARANEIKKWME